MLLRTLGSAQSPRGTAAGEGAGPRGNVDNYGEAEGVVGEALGATSFDYCTAVQVNRVVKTEVERALEPEVDCHDDDQAYGTAPNEPLMTTIPTEVPISLPAFSTGSVSPDAGLDSSSSDGFVMVGSDGEPYRAPTYYAAVHDFEPSVIDLLSSVSGSACEVECGNDVDSVDFDEVDSEVQSESKTVINDLVSNVSSSGKGQQCVGEYGHIDAAKLSSESCGAVSECEEESDFEE
ncbi:hypothetical protein ON010_g16841 [Phytophthora cinnamomi]|nr:hypothetical protein ON010_g16841 [Phytophthora cinnamomi]